MVVEFIGIVAGKSSLISSKFGVFYNVDLVDEKGQKIVDPETGVDISFKIVVKDVNDEKDPRNKLKVGDKVRVTCQRREGSCSVTPVQDMEILESGIQLKVKRRCIFGRITKKNDPKDYGHGIIKMYVVIRTPEQKEYRLMIQIKDPLNDKVLRLKMGDRIEVLCDDTTESEWCSVENENVKILDTAAPACEVTSAKTVSSMENWFLQKSGKMFVESDIRMIFKLLTIMEDRPVRASYFGIGLTKMPTHVWKRLQELWGESFEKRIHIMDSMKEFGWIDAEKTDEIRYFTTKKGKEVLSEFNKNYPAQF